MSPHGRTKEEIIKDLNSIIDLGHEIIIGYDKSKTTIQHHIDQAMLWKEIIPLTSSDLDLEQIEIPVKTLEHKYQSILSHKEIISLGATDTSSTFTLSASASFANPDYIEPVYQEKANPYIVKLHDIVTQSTKKDTALELMGKFGFSKAPGWRKSASSQFEEGWAAYEAPVTQNNPATTSLIPLRESINMIISELIRRAPAQRKAKNEKEKICFILEELSLRPIEEIEKEEFSKQWSSINDELSESKSLAYTRNKWHECLLIATNFIIGFLGCLDHNKLRP